MREFSSQIPSYSEAALAARDMFFSTYNQVSFYVEDEDQENLYVCILGKLFPNIAIDQIFPLGGKTAVLKHLEAPENKESLKKSIYIVDKDFDDILNKKIIHDRLFYLEKYSIENFLFEENAVIEVATEESPKIKREELAIKINYKVTCREFFKSLLKLIRLFILVQTHQLTIKNTSLNIEQFTENKKQFRINNDKVSSYSNEVFELLRKGNVISTRAEFEKKLTEVLPYDFEKIEKHACGKHLLSMMMHFLGSVTGKGCIDKASLTYRLAKNCSFTSLNNLKHQIHAVL